MNADTVIRIEGLKKSYDGSAVLDVESLEIPAGALISLIGPNGVGKSTLLEILAGIRSADSGIVGINGKVLLLPQRMEAFERLTVRQNISYFAKLFGREDSDEIMRLAGVDSYAGVLYHILSGGYRRRVCIACTLCGSPDILLMDEPMTGLDPEARAEIWELLRSLTSEGITVILSTHDRTEAMMYSDAIAVLSQRGIELKDAMGIDSHIVRIREPVDRSILSDLGAESDGDFAVLGPLSTFELTETLVTLRSAGISEERISVISGGQR